MRPDLDIVAAMIDPGSRVLDLGCGDGALLENLIAEHDCSGLGVEHDPDGFHSCIARGVPVTQGDLESELPAIDTGTFDVAILSLTLQAVRHPDRVLAEMKRVAPRQIVSLPNFGHLRLRSGLALNGRMPVTSALPYQWFNTPNIHLCTLRDFEQLTTDTGMRILRRVVLDGKGEAESGPAKLLPNLLAQGAVYTLGD
ncbi:MAG: methionine biosynthesis protein MetW [Solirubrobacterales bacterium]